MNEAAIQFDREQGIPETLFSGGTARRVGEIYPLLKQGINVDLNEWYPVKKAPVYEIDFSQLNIDHGNNL